ncbi:hypothetical protein FOA43_001276 [Brettanomyces nanus]|uniref:Major facilitator superfamily (MFS) profile domain-containing protein n=1 Tax=Eeniella nana TaxID=13502 RepID=A0A875RX29_EENNA|nr:uncharacterized protein FOA43_001276 [Brettanomyces nanus]QPG73961.1 hypothetical protein FOA43_001276 [Brettanomyces nanus]
MSSILSKASQAFSNGRTIVPDRYRNKKFVYLIILLGLTMDNFNVTGALTTSYSIEKYFHASSATASWALSAYALTLGSFIILFGKIGDIIGPHNTYMIGLMVMCFFSLLTAIPQPSIIALIVFRALQGIGGAALMPSGFALAANYFQGAELEWAIRLLSIVLTGSLGLGILLGGVFSVTNIGYQGFFYFTFGLSLTCLVILFFLMIPIEKTDNHKEMKLRDLDYPGVFLLVVGLLLVIFGLTEAGSSWKTPKVYVTIPIGGLLIIFMVCVETLYFRHFKNNNNAASRIVTRAHIDIEDQNKVLDKTESDNGSDQSTIQSYSSMQRDWRVRIQLIFPAEVFKLPNFLFLGIGVFCCLLAYVAFVSALIQYNILLHGNTPLIASVKILPMAVGTVLGSILYRSKYAIRVGIRNTLIFSASLLLGGSIWVSRTDYKVINDYWKFQFASQFIMGFGVNIFFMVYLNAIMSQTPLHLQGVVSGIFQTFGQVGVAIGSALFTTVVGVLVIQTESAAKEEQFKKFRNAYYIGITSAILFIACLFVKDPYRKSKGSAQGADSTSENLDSLQSGDISETNKTNEASDTANKIQA